MSEPLIPLSIFLDTQKETATAIVTTASDIAEMRAARQAQADKMAGELSDIKTILSKSAKASRVAEARWDFVFKVPAITALVLGISIGAIVTAVALPALDAAGLVERITQVETP